MYLPNITNYGVFNKNTNILNGIDANKNTFCSIVLQIKIILKLKLYYITILITHLLVFEREDNFVYQVLDYFNLHNKLLL